LVIPYTNIAGLTVSPHAKGGHTVPTSKVLLRSRDVAWILDCSPDEVVELVKRRKLKATKKGRFWMYRPEDVEAYGREQEQREVA
jgi:hypothetical protein